jgi:hypothetical protein
MLFQSDPNPTELLLENVQHVRVEEAKEQRNEKTLSRKKDN